MASRTPLNFLLAIFPGYQLLDLAGPLDIFNILSLEQPDTPLTLTFISDTLDPVASKPLPRKNASWSFDLESAFPHTDGKVNTTFNQYLTPDTTFDEYLKAAEAGELSQEGRLKPLDVLFIPGGFGSRVQRVHPDGSKTSNVQPLVDFIVKVAPHIKEAIITVCTGSDILARTGLLDGRRATVNMYRFQSVTEQNPTVNWQNWARWVRSQASEADGKGVGVDIWSSAGVSAGMDVTLAFITHHYGGLGVSREVAKKLEYDWREIEEAAVDPLYIKHFAK